MPLDPKIVAPGEGRTVKLFGVRFDYRVESTESGGSLAVLEVTIPPGTLVKPHGHTAEGGSLVKPRGIPHAMWNTSDQPARVLEILSPGGLEEYFDKLGPVLAHEGGAGAKEYYKLARAYGLTIEDDWIEELESTYGVKL